MIYSKDYITRRNIYKQQNYNFSSQNNQQEQNNKDDFQEEQNTKSNPYVFLVATGILGFLVFLQKLNSVQNQAKEKGVKFAEKHYGKPDIGGSWQLIDKDGNKFTSDDLKGKYYIIYFGFCNCPDICPQSMTKLSKAYEMYQKKGKQKYGDLKLVFVSVDPDRDSPKTIQKFLTLFQNNFIGVTGLYNEDPKLKEMMRKFKIYSSKIEYEDQDDEQPENINNSYTLDHTVISYIMDHNSEYLDHLGASLSANEIHQKIIEALSYDRTRLFKQFLFIMKGIIYFKKWTQMPWFSRLYHIKNQSYNYTLDKKCREVYHLCLMSYQDTKDAIEEHKKEYFKRYLYNSDEPITTKDKGKLDYLIKVLFKKYPQMAQVTWGTGDTYSDDQNVQFYKIVNGLYRKYLKLLKSGYKKEIATEKVLKEFEDRILLKLEEIGVTENLAESQRGVSVMNYFLHQSLQESNNKLLRVKRDHQIQKFLDDDQLQQNTKFFSKIQNYNEPHEDNMQTFDSENFVSVYKRSHEFQQSYDYIFQMYYNDAFQRDNLQTLQQYQVLRQIRYLPNLLQKEFRPLIFQLFKHNIKLSDSGEVDFSQCQDINVRNKFEKKQSIVKYALQLNDLSFGFIHRQNLQNKYHKMKKQIQEFNQEARDQIEKQQQEYLEKMKKLRSLDLSKIDKMLQFKYFQQQELNEDNYQDTLKKMHMTFQQFLSGVSPRVDKYDLKTLDQNSKNLLLESQWIKMKLERLELIDDTSSEVLLDNYVNSLKQINEELRHLKLTTDSKLNEQTNKIFFDEHRGIEIDQSIQNLETVRDLKQVHFDTENYQYPAFRNIDRILNHHYLKIDYTESQDKELTKKDSQDYFWNKQANEMLQKINKVENDQKIRQYDLEKSLLTFKDSQKYESDLVSQNEKFKEFMDQKNKKLLLARQEIQRIEEDELRQKLEKQLNKKKSRKELRKDKHRKKKQLNTRLTFKEIQNFSNPLYLFFIKFYLFYQQNFIFQNQSLFKIIYELFFIFQQFLYFIWIYLQFMLIYLFDYQFNIFYLYYYPSSFFKHFLFLKLSFCQNIFFIFQKILQFYQGIFICFYSALQSLNSFQILYQLCTGFLQITLQFTILLQILILLYFQIIQIVMQLLLFIFGIFYHILFVRRKINNVVCIL